MKLIVNADDFGLSKGVNLGIIEAHRNGIVTSTTLMVTMNEVEDALELAKKYPNLGIGLHLNCTLGKPLTPCFSLIKENGEFYKPKENPNQENFKEEEFYQEFLAQYELFVQLTKKKPTHIDSHLYAHQKYAKAKSAALRLAKEKEVAIRDAEVPYYEMAHFIGSFKCNEKITEQQALQIIIGTESEILKYPIVELMCHPAYLDQYLYETSSYHLGRMKELRILTSNEVKQFIEKNKIELVNFTSTRRKTPCQR